MQYYIAYGDTSGVLGFHDAGGDQTLLGQIGPGMEWDVTLVGDAASLVGHATGGNDSVVGPNVGMGINRLVGDAEHDMTGHAEGGADTLVGGRGTYLHNMLFGDAGGTMSGHAKGGDDVLLAGTGVNLLVGDAETLLDHARGGNDLMVGTSGRYNGADFFGDAHGEMGNHAAGGADTIICPAGTLFTGGTAYGDAFLMSGNAKGGNDLIEGGGGAGHVVQFFGDAQSMIGRAQGGDDTLESGTFFLTGAYAEVSEMYGDARTMADRTRGGSDALTGGDGAPRAGFVETLCGDAGTMSGQARGGDDTLTARTLASALYGDGVEMAGNAAGGNDRLVSGTANDRMYGDAQQLGAGATGGCDTFVFLAAFGNDTIGDFHRGEDRIELEVPGVAGMDDLCIDTASGSTLISVAGQGSILLEGVTAPLSASDFVFA